MYHPWFFIFCTIGNTWYFLLTTKYCRLQLKDYCRLAIKHVKVKYLSCYIGFLVLERPCWMERIPRYGYSYWASSIALLLILIYWFESVYVWSCEILLTEIMQMYITVNVKNEKGKMNAQYKKREFQRKFIKLKRFVQKKLNLRELHKFLKSSQNLG